MGNKAIERVDKGQDSDMIMVMIEKNQILKKVKENKKAIIVGTLVVAALFVYFVNGKYTDANPDTPYEIVHVEQHDLKKSISVSGEIISDTEVKLGSDVAGQLTAIYVEVGQKVKKGEIIANVENRTQRAQVTQALGALQSARAQVLSSEAQLQKVLNGSSQGDKNIVASQVSAAEYTLVSAQDTARNVLQSAYAGTVSAVPFGTDIAMQDTSTVNPTLAFQTTEYSAKISAENQRVVVGDILTRHSAQSAYSLTDVDLAEELESTKSDLIAIRKLTDSLLTALGGAINTAAVTTSTISSYTTAVSTARNQLLANITALTSAQSAITSANKALGITKENEYKVLDEVRTEDVDAARAGVSAAEASVVSASGNYQVSKTALDKTYIYSPHAGVVVDIYKEVGEFTSSSLPIVKISSEGEYISALVSEVDITKVKIGMEARVSLDALPEEVFAGTVDFIYPDKQEVLGIRYYEISISSDTLQSSDLTVLPGMSLDVSILYDTKQSVLAVERGVAKKDGDAYFVHVLNPGKVKPIDDKFKKVFFESGFIGDEYVEVLSGLAKDAEVVKFMPVK